MSATHASTDDHYQPGRYEIRLKGHLEPRWAAWFEGLTLTHEHGPHPLRRALGSGATLVSCALLIGVAVT